MHMLNHNSFLAGWVIRSTERDAPNCYFVAIHGFSPFFSNIDRAHRFATKANATAYALDQLFVNETAFYVEFVDHTAP